MSKFYNNWSKNEKMKASFLGKNWKIIFKKLRQGLKITLLAIVIYFLLAIVLSFIPVNNQTLECDEHKIYLTTNGIHVDIILLS